jgi:hypothetical protein
VIGRSPCSLASALASALAPESRLPSTGPIEGDGRLALPAQLESTRKSTAVDPVPNRTAESATPEAVALNSARVDGGRYKETNPIAEAKHVEAVDAANARNLRPLIRRLKASQDTCNVPIKSFTWS